jgi:hypothetical protein
MRKVKNYWMVMLLGAVLMSTLVGVAWARPNGRPMAAVTRRITIPAGHFIPTKDDWDYNNQGIYVRHESGDGSFTAPVVFPTGQAVVVESVTLYVYDNDADDDICLDLYRQDPTDASEGSMAYLCSSGNSTTDPRSFTDSSIGYNPVKHGKGVYLWLTIGDYGINLKAYGVRIEYHNGTT